jgi:ATP-dependent DNA helicase RecG
MITGGDKDDSRNGDFKRNYIDPLLELRILVMTQPDSPKSPTQKYYLTEIGKTFLEK